MYGRRMYDRPPALAIDKAIRTLLDNDGIRSASIYHSPTCVVTATRRRKADKRSVRLELLVTMGKPNFRGRMFVKACLKAKEPFPVTRPQLRWVKGAKP